MPIDSAIYDITKNVIVAAPAGSGKTEKLSRRYIALLSAGIGPERILAITFTEKAAAEMKDRILRILKNENPELYKKIKEKVEANFAYKRAKARYQVVNAVKKFG